MVIAIKVRKELGDIQDLAEDMKQNGLIHPVVITEDGILITGERRLEAAKLLGWEEIDARIMSVRDYEHQLRIEISENELRKDFSRLERLDYAKQLERLKAKERQGARNDIVQNFAGSDQGTARDKVAEQAGFGSGEQKFIPENLGPR